jgi:hypothetical protein
MAGEPESKKETPTLEMRLAAIEDKLARLTVTEEEMATFSKVSALATARGGTPSMGLPSNPVPASWIRIADCWIWIQPIQPPVVNDCILFQATQTSSGAGFARLGRG